MDTLKTGHHAPFVLESSITLNELVTRQPQTHAVLSGHGMDTCCGGAKTLAEAATAHGISLDELLKELEAVL